jgi:AcrR family transcriptional regulator
MRRHRREEVGLGLEVETTMTATARDPGDEGGSPAEAKTPRQGRGRPSRQQAQAIDQRVLESARLCFLASGFNGATMDAIAEHAGVSKVTLYQRHADKEALMRAVMHERIATWSVISRQRIVSRGDTLDQRLRHYARSMLRWSSDPEIRAFADLIRGCWGAAPAIAEEMEAIRFGRMLAVIEADIVEFSAKEHFVVKEPRQLAEMLMAMLTAFPPPAAGDEEAIASCADKAVDILMHGRRAWSMEDEADVP